jgi:hypothetical protein
LPLFSHHFPSLLSRNPKFPLPFLAFAIVGVPICNSRDSEPLSIASDFPENYLDNL